MPEQAELPGARQVLTLLEDAVRFAETMAFPPTDRSARTRIGEELIPALFEARTYLEVGHLRAPEIKNGISKASLVASDLADDNPAFGPLHSRLRVLLEEAGLASRGD
jgi:hypothetical protein